MTDMLLTHIDKSFGDKQVLRRFSARFPAGSVTCVMGPSGCGKTTLLRLLMGLEAPDAGGLSGVPERFSAVFQEDRLCEDFNAVTNIRAAVGKGVPEQEIRAHLTQLGLGESLAVPVRTLSGGMKRRVAIARAVLAPGGALFLDEPFKGLDEALRGEVAAYLLERRRDRTLVVVTHDPDEIALLGGAVLRMAAAE